MMGHGYFGGGSLLIWIIGAALIVIPFWRLLPRFGIPSWVALFSFIPLVALVLLWIMAFKDELDGKGGAA